MAISSLPKILALDFDGVICNGLWEYFQTTQRTYQQIWKNESQINLDLWADSFYQLRPVIETGWEMPILLRALVLAYNMTELEENWPQICSTIVGQENLDKKQVMAQLDGVRDHWIQTDLEGWLSLHHFYSGILERLEEILSSSTQLYIVTTKEGRFVKQLLKKQGLNFPENHIFGKEVKQPKFETLRQILKDHNEDSANLWFVEDLLKTLQGVQSQADLTEVSLFLADWGYNTEKSHKLTQPESNLYLLSLSQFNQDFSTWRS
ncbi:HAD family hydrolase [Crocosphaera sp. UHCC 0190]|uniref:HAD family hydrolase n=1 Tax=Crocosphaera sp. UHCC 0190 TaxID=3110246 RepID=UPI002B1F7621|nr:HAD family hydrolase [Crocosphaera sp. UHCC 0190]MEA5511603.1 HAD family hydrolase [Crocosphaera sp. UHCC 0190]